MTDFDKWYTDQVENNTFYLEPKEIAKSGFIAGVKSKEKESKRLRTALESIIKHLETIMEGNRLTMSGTYSIAKEALK